MARSKPAVSPSANTDDGGTTTTAQRPVSHRQVPVAVPTQQPKTPKITQKTSGKMTDFASTTAPVSEGNGNTLTPQEKALMTQQKAREQEYIQMVNDYQLAQMQKKLADVNAQLAQAKLKEAQSIAKATQQNVSVTTTSTHHTASLGTAAVLRYYSLLYVSYVNNHWTATLRYAGRLHNVYIGSQFVDGTSVRVIDRNGVVLERNGVSQYLTIPIPMTMGQSGGAITGSKVDATENPNDTPVRPDPNEQASQSAEQIYNTLSNIQQAMPKGTAVIVGLPGTKVTLNCVKLGSIALIVQPEIPYSR